MLEEVLDDDVVMVLCESWEWCYKGLENVGWIVIFDGGFKWE